jgi:hypothetical protein
LEDFLVGVDELVMTNEKTKEQDIVPVFELIAGWDPGLETFFCRSDDEILAGTFPHACKTVQDLEKTMTRAFQATGEDFLEDCSVAFTADVREALKKMR